jgi:hypothetical protein
VSQCAKMHVAGWTWAVFTRVIYYFYGMYIVSGIFWIYLRMIHITDGLIADCTLFISSFVGRKNIVT